MNPTDRPAGRVCVAMDAHFNLRCGASAVATARLGDRSGPVCAEDAERAASEGWTITWDQEASDV